MSKKRLFATVSLALLHSIKASQPMMQSPMMQGPMHNQMHPQMHTQMHNQAGSPSHCPSCPYGGMGGWVLIPAGPGGMPCNQGASAPMPTEPQPIQQPAPEMANPPHPHAVIPHEMPPHSSMHPGSMHRQAQSDKVHNTTPPRMSHKDLQEGINAFLERKNKRLAQAETQPLPAPTIAPQAGQAQVPPPPPGGAPNLNPPTFRKSWPKVNVPDVLGTTEARVQSVYTNPTEGNQRQFGLGAPNRAQTGVIGQPTPNVNAVASTPPSIPAPAN